MNVIRIYDNRKYLYNELRKGKVFQRLVKPDVRVDYCTLVEHDNQYMRMKYCYKQSESGECVIREELGWDMEDNDQYYVFLDTLWEELHEDEQIFGVPKDLIIHVFKDNRVVSLTVYTVFDPIAVRDLYEKIIEYRDDHPNDYYPDVNGPFFVYADDDEENIVFFQAPLGE